MSVDPVRGSRLVDVSFTSVDPQFAATAANALVTVYVRQNLSVKQETTASTLTWLANRNILNLPEDRRHGRFVPKIAGARLIMPNGTNIGVRIIDLSLSGAGIATTQRPEVGSLVSLGKIPGRVVRHLEDGFAIEFTRLQHPDSLEENASAQ